LSGAARGRAIVGSLAGVVGIAAVFRGVLGAGSANYDTMFALLWGREVARGQLPEYAIALAPTPKPGAIALGVLLSPLGHTAEPVALWIAYASIGALALAGYVLASAIAGRPAGAVAAGLILTREPVLSFGLRAYADVSYAALVLLAASVEVRRPRAGTPVLALLAAAGLLRPEAWLISAVYVAWLWRGASRAQRLTSFAWLAAAPFAWIVGDWIATAHPLWSLTGTRASAEVLQRETGITAVVRLLPRRIGEIVREPVLLAAPVGFAFVMLTRRADSVRVAAVASVAVVAFAMLAVAGLPILGRYLLVPACLLMVWAAAGLAGWLQLSPDDRLRRPWQLAALAAAVAMIAFAPSQLARLTKLHRVLGAQAAIAADLHGLADSGALSHCATVVAPNHRPVPALALWLNRSAESINGGLTAARGSFVVAGDDRVRRLFALDRRDPAGGADPPSDALVRATTRYWRILERC
jgi:hypothetical protein